MWIPRGRECQRDRPIGGQFDAAIHVRVHFAVAAKSMGLHVYGAYQCAIAADGRTGVVQRGPAIPDQRNVRGGAANIADDKVVVTAQEACANDAGCWSGQNGLNRLFHDTAGAGNRPVPAHDHDARVDTVMLHCGLHRPLQCHDQADYARVECSRERTSRAVQCIGQLAGCGDRAASMRTNKFFDALLVCWIAHGVVRRHRERLGGSDRAIQRSQQCTFIQRGLLFSCMAVPAVQAEDMGTRQSLRDLCALCHSIVEANQDGGYGRAMSLDQRVGRERGG